ncbi:MAG: PTS sugar transporter subunit IIA [Thermoanaerobaculia bacterium]
MPLQLGASRFSSPSLMLPRLSSASRQSALREMIEPMAAEGVVEDASRVLTLAEDRERIASTALEGGLAFPHVRGIEGGGMVFSLGLSSEGVLFDAALGQRTHIIVFTVVPVAASSLYLRLVSELLQALGHQSSRARLLASPTASALWRTLGLRANESKRSEPIRGKRGRS